MPSWHATDGTNIVYQISTSLSPFVTLIFPIRNFETSFFQLSINVLLLLAFPSICPFFSKVPLPFISTFPLFLSVIQCLLMQQSLSYLDVLFPLFLFHFSLLLLLPVADFLSICCYQVKLMKTKNILFKLPRTKGLNPHETHIASISNLLAPI